ncbi:FMN-binding protein [Cellulomonas sp. P22]|uniref:FMN-binding protein n=1 Tax=Cellulomonas sp. P22 TaxID=3373189 RepID=UPI003797AE7B
MRRIILALGCTAAGLVLLFSWPTSWNRPVGTGAGTDASRGVPSSGGAGADAGTQPDAGADAAGGTFVGRAVPNGHGDVQVQITVADGAVTAAQATEYPTDDARARQINTRAIPILDEEAVGVTDAQALDMVSGATLTSDAYRESLQDALDQAGL